MTKEFVITFGRDALYISMLVAGPLLIIALVVGLVISIFQAVTQIQEMTLAIIPKMIAVILGLVVLYPWLLSQLIDYMERVFNGIPNAIGL